MYFIKIHYLNSDAEFGFLTLCVCVCVCVLRVISSPPHGPLGMSRDGLMEE